MMMDSRSVRTRSYAVDNEEDALRLQGVRRGAAGVRVPS